MTNASLMERAAEALGSRGVGRSFTERELLELAFNWAAWARPSQLPPLGPWLVWLLQAGRGYGKTRTGGETVRAEVEAARAGHIALVAKTPADVRDVMVEGDSGFLQISPPWFMPKYEPSKRRLTWPNGAWATCFSGADPDQLRGPQHDFAWCDELTSWQYPKECWDNLMFGLRMGANPRAIVTTTPKPIQVLRDLINSPTTVVTRGNTYENRANLAPSFFQWVVAQYEGTRLGRQEIYADLLEDVPGALWKRSFIHRIDPKKAPDLKRIVTAIDPATSSGEDADETGIVVAGRGMDNNYYVLLDRSARLTPDGWARRAIKAHEDVRGDRIIGEVNNGGEMVEQTLRTVRRDLPYTAVHASRGKAIRAEPVAALYEQGKVFHIGEFDELEDQLCTWTPDSGKSPDRLDALVWAITALMARGEPRVTIL